MQLKMVIKLMLKAERLYRKAEKKIKYYAKISEKISITKFVKNHPTSSTVLQFYMTLPTYGQLSGEIQAQSTPLPQPTNQV